MFALMFSLDVTFEGLGASNDCQRASTSQLSDGDCCPASIFRLMANVVDQRMSGQKFRQTPTQGSRSVSMNDSNARQAAERRLVEKFIYTARGFLHRAANNIYLFVRGLVALLRVNRYAVWTGRCGHICFRWFRIKSDGGHIRKRNTHPQRSSLYFRHPPVQPAKYQRLFESFHYHAQPGNKLFGSYRLCWSLRSNSKVRLRRS